MKYVMFTQVKTLRRMPVVFTEHTTHSEVKLEGHVATSAGFFNIEKLQTFGESRSLALAPMPGDEMLIAACLSGTFESSWALLQDFDENAKRLEDFCSECGHLLLAHKKDLDSIHRCEISGCGCKRLYAPKKVQKNA
jgi:hypothetical protein